MRSFWVFTEQTKGNNQKTGEQEEATFDCVHWFQLEVNCKMKNGQLRVSQLSVTKAQRQQYWNLSIDLNLFKLTSRLKVRPFNLVTNFCCPSNIGSSFDWSSWIFDQISVIIISIFTQFLCQTISRFSQRQSMS